MNNDLDNVLNNINERNPVRLRDYTPDILVQNGIKNLPMYENPSHIRKNILTAKEAQNLGLSVMPNDHYHGLGKDVFIKAIDSLDNPRVVFKRNNSNDYMVLTAIKDNNNNNVIVPIEIETTTNVNKIKIDTNRIKTVYGYDITHPNLDEYIRHNLKNKEFTKIYEQKKERGTGFSTAAGSFNDNNITQSKDNVKLPTKYSMQENVNNTQEQAVNNLNNTSFSIENSNNLRYNSIEEAIKVDNRKASYRKYSNCVEFFNLDYNTMKRAIAIGSKYALEAQNMGLDSYSFNDEKYIYGLEIIDKSNNSFGITKVEEIQNIIKELDYEKYTTRDNRLSERQYGLYERTNDYDHQSIANQTTSNQFSKLGENSKINDLVQHEDESSRNSKKGLDNSSFSLEEKQSLKANNNNDIELKLEVIYCVKLIYILSTNIFHFICVNS